MTPVVYRQLRGLSLHFRKHWPAIRRRAYFDRALFGAFGLYRGPKGICGWCDLPTAKKRTSWHQECVDAYRMATGQNLRHRWTIKERPPCPCGQQAQELDHQDALVLAWTSGDPRRMVRASALCNLIWLCRKCHREKTTEDLRRLSELRATHVCLMGLIPSTDPKMGIERWTCVEGGLITRIANEDGVLVGTKKGERRGPVTYCPSAASCPRCLVAMETGPNTHGQGMVNRPQGWYVDDYHAKVELLFPARFTQRLKSEERRAAAIAAGQLELI